MVTHDPVAAGYADRVVFLADGRIVDEMSTPTADRVLDRMKRFGELTPCSAPPSRASSARKLRLLHHSIAVVLGVAFMAGTLVLTDTIGKTFDNLFANVNAGTDAVRAAARPRSASEIGDQRGRLDAVTRHDRSPVPGVKHGRGQHPGLRPARRQARQGRSAIRRWARRRSAASGSTDARHSTRSSSRRPGAAGPTPRS